MAIWSERSLHGFEFDDVAVTVMVITVLLVGIAMWQQIVQVTTSTVLNVLHPSDPVVVGGLVSGVLFLGGLGLVTISYARFRGIKPGTILPSPVDLKHLALAVLVPLGFVSVTKLVGVALIALGLEVGGDTIAGIALAAAGVAFGLTTVFINTS
jgi:hypothetical protein